MIDVAPYEHCVCRGMGNRLALCDGALIFSEQGKKVRLAVKSGEEAKALVLDGCVFMDNKLKCDGLFLYRGATKKVAMLVELKGASEIPHAFKQLAYVRRSRPEYRQLIDQFAADGAGQVIEKAIIVSNGILNKPEHEALEKQYNIRVAAILHSEATSPMPDARQYL